MCQLGLNDVLTCCPSTIDAGKTAGAQVIISEVADKGTSNACTDKADWVELQNTGSSTVSLAGFKLHDDVIVQFKACEGHSR